MTVADFATKRVVSTTMILIFMVFSGVVAMRSMKQELIPDFNFPLVAVNTTWTGAASEDVKTQISKKIEMRHLMLMVLKTFRQVQLMELQVLW